MHLFRIKPNNCILKLKVIKSVDEIPVRHNEDEPEN